MPHRKLQGAADKIGVVLASASPSPWKLNTRNGEVTSADGHTIVQPHYLKKSQGLIDSEYVALLQPDVATALYRLLDSQADLHKMNIEKCFYCNKDNNPLDLPCPALELADAILNSTY